MTTITLARFAKARIGTEVQTMSFPAAGVAKRQIQCRPYADGPALRVAFVEAFVPRGAKSDYGLIGVEFARGGDCTTVGVPFSRRSGPLFAESLALRVDEARVGLPEEFVESVLAAGVEAADALPCGSLAVVGAVHGLVGSSPKFFGRLMRAAVVLLRFGLDNDETERLLRETLL